MKRAAFQYRKALLAFSEDERLAKNQAQKEDIAQKRKVLQKEWDATQRITTLQLMLFNRERTALEYQIANNRQPQELPPICSEWPRK